MSSNDDNNNELEPTKPTEQVAADQPPISQAEEPVKPEEPIKPEDVEKVLDASVTDKPTGVAAEAAVVEEVKPLPKRKTLSIIIHDATVLRAAYMQFIKGGGLFIPTKKTFKMGEDTNLVIRLLDEDEPYRVSGKVVWITPINTTSNKAAGIGVEFAEDKHGERLRSRIEIILGPHLKSQESTHTM